MIQIKSSHFFAAVLAPLSLVLALCSVPHAATIDTDCSQTPAIRKLLDTWRGEGAVLAEARKRIDTTLLIDPNCAPAFRELARYYIMKGHLVGRKFRPGYLMSAQVSLDSALRLDPDYADAYVLYGHLYHLQRKPEQAHAALDMAEKLGTDNPWLPLNRATLLFTEGRIEEAVELYRHVLKQKPDNKKAMSAAFGGMISCHKKRGDLGSADLTYQELIAFEPESAWNYGDYANFLLYHQGNFERAITMGRMALKIMDYGIGRKTLAAALYRKWAHYLIEEKDPAKAQPFFDEAYSLFPNIESIKEDARLSTHTLITIDAFELIKVE